jgi:hypothetical protein
LEHLPSVYNVSHNDICGNVFIPTYQGEATFLFASAGFLQGFAGAVDIGRTLLVCDESDTIHPLPHGRGLPGGVVKEGDMIRRREM